MSTKNVDPLTAAQCRAARGLLELTQSGLAEEARLGLSTIVDFEKSRRQISMDAVGEIKKALEKLGVEFIGENGGGPGVRLRKSSEAKPKRK